MEIREWAVRILSTDHLDDKLFKPELLTDEEPGPPIIFKEPCRPQNMGFNRRSKEEKLPPFQDLHQEDKRAICLHRFAGHELLAVEIMAYVLLAFPDAPKNFRKGVAHVLQEEQDHVSLYKERLKAMGVNFGDLPLYRHFWTHTPYITSPLHYVSMMSLTFEMANLDFAPIYGKTFAHVGDQASAELMATILKDEISHVRFGWQWLKNLKNQNESEWDTWEKILKTTLLTPKRAKGFYLHPEHREKAGVSQEFISNLKLS